MIISFLLFIFSFLVFIRGVSPSVYGGDSGDIILASWFGGVAHPPGYPLNTMIGWIFTHLPYDATVAYKANLMAAFLMAIVVGVTYLIIHKIIKNLFVAITSALILAFVPLFWLYAHIIEVFQLNLILIAFSVYFLFSWRESVVNRKHKTIFLYLSSLFLGLAVFHHHTALLVLPAYLYLILKINRKIVKNYQLLIKLAIFFILGFLPYIFIPFAALRKTPINWDDPSNITNFIRLIIRGDYGTFTATDYLMGSALKVRVIQLLNFGLFLKADFKILGLFICLIGFIYSFLRQRVIFWFTFLAVFFTGPFFLFYASFPLANDFYRGLWERFVLTSYFFMVIYLAFGLKTIFEMIKYLFGKKINLHFLEGHFLADLCAALFLIIFPSYMIIENYNKADLSRFYLGDWLAHDVLVSAEPNSIVLLLGDTMAFNTDYYYRTNENFRNMKIIRGGMLHRVEYRKEIIREYSKDLNIPDTFYSDDSKKDSSYYIKDLINSNISQFSIYSADYLPDVENHKWMSAGLLKKLVSSNEYSKEELIRLNEDRFIKFKFSDFAYDFGFEQYNTGHIKEIYYRSLVDLADELIINKAENEAEKYLDNAVVLRSDIKEAYIRLGNIFAVRNECDKSRENFEMVSNLDKKDWQVLIALSRVYEECYKDEVKAKNFWDAADNLRRSVSDKSMENF